MAYQRLARRRFLLCGAALATISASPAFARGAAPVIYVMKDPNCGCCTAWMQVLKDEGFNVTSEASAGAALIQYKLQNGIPQNMMACHTARIDGYLIEGHVPAEDIRRLLKDKPDAVGLAVPGMPYGSPGMGPETGREAYDVYLVERDGSVSVFSSFDAA